MRSEEWRRYLTEYSAEVLRWAPEEALADVSERQRADRWLGFDGAGADRIEALERRLGVRLPPGYRAFLSVSDGWLNLGPFMWTMRTADEVGWFRDADPETWEILRGDPEDEEFELIDRALLISREGDVQWWLLDPGDISATGEWAAYVWASWYPGLGDRHESFAALVGNERTSFASLHRPDQPAGTS